MKHQRTLCAYVLFLSLSYAVAGYNTSLAVSPETLDLYVDEARSLNVTYSCDVTSDDVDVHLTSADVQIADVIGPSVLPLCRRRSHSAQTAEFRVVGRFIGTVQFTFQLKAVNGTLAEDSLHYDVIVIREVGFFYMIFIVVTIIFVIILNIGFGCSIDIEVVKEILRKPIAPAIGFLCQFALMPMLGFAVSRALQMQHVYGFGVLVTACAPGGGASNVWTLLLGGDLDLSLTMTFLSKMAAIGMVPFWMWALGRFYVDSVTDIAIPYANMAAGMAGIGIPCLIGVLVSRYRPAVGARVCTLVKPLAGLFLLWVIVAGSLTNLFIYRVMVRVWYIIPAGMLLPYTAFALGYLFARGSRQPPHRAATIAIETGIQDTGVSIILLLATFPKPLGDLAAVVPMTVAMLTPLPLAVLLVGITLHRRSAITYRVSDDTAKVKDVDAVVDTKDGPEMGKQNGSADPARRQP